MRVHPVPATTLVLVALLVGGCYETKSTYTINPDGTGKVHLEARFQPMMLSMGAESKDPEDKARKAARQLIDNAKGIDIWKDVTVKAGDDGRTEFSGTAYFRDVSRVKFQNLGSTAATVSRDGNTLTLTVTMGDGDEDEDVAVQTDMTEEELAAAIKRQRAEYQASKPMMAGFLATMKSDSTFVLPGALTASTNFKKLDNGRLSVGFDGARLLGALDRVMADDALLRKSILRGRQLLKDGPGGGQEMNEALFGAKGPICAVTSGPFQPLFDYDSELAAAREAYPVMAKALGVRDTAPVEPVKAGEGLERVTIGGVRHVLAIEEKTGLRPFNQKAGYSVCLIAEFAGAIVSLDEAEVDRVVADTGADLLPEREWNRKAHFPSLSEERTAVTFTFDLKPLPRDVRGIKELCGVVRYRCAGTTRKANVGITRFEAGAEGTEFGARIKTIKPSDWVKGGTTLSLELELDKTSIKSIAFYDKDDFELEFDRKGSSWGDGKCTFEYTTKGKFPEEGRIVLEVYEAQRKHEVPFTITNVDLLGYPLK